MKRVSGVRTRNNIEMHELIGLECEVVDSTNPLQIGIKGYIVDETKNMLVIETPRGRKMVMKKGAKFKLKLDDGYFILNGDRVNFRPHERIRKVLRRRRRW